MPVYKYHARIVRDNHRVLDVEIGEQLLGARNGAHLECLHVHLFYGIHAHERPFVIVVWELETKRNFLRNTADNRKTVGAPCAFLGERCKLKQIPWLGLSKRSYKGRKNLSFARNPGE